MKRAVLSLLLICLLAMPGVVNAKEIEGLRLYFEFEEGEGDTAVDSSGNDNDGTIAGDAEWVDSLKIGVFPRQRDFGLALQFNGFNVVVRAPHIPLDNRSFTIMMWAKALWKGTVGGGGSICSQQQSVDDNLTMVCGFGVSPESGTYSVGIGFYYNDLGGSGVITEEDAWYHLTFWYDFEDNIRRAYVNGEQVAEDAPTSPFLGTSGDTVVGGWDANDSRFMGLVDEFRIYDRPLTEDEIQEIMTGEGYAVYPKDKLATTWGDLKAQ